MNKLILVNRYSSADFKVQILSNYTNFRQLQ